MPWPIAHGPDIHGTYQRITGEPMPNWPLFSHKMSEGANSGDKGFPTRWPWMREQGFKYRGAYHWLRSDSSVKSQVDNVIRRLSFQDGLLIGEFIQNDWEVTPGITINKAEDAIEFNDRLEQHYQRFCTITYLSDWLPDSELDPDLFKEFFEWLELTQGNSPMWYANYNSSLTSPTGGWKECEKYSADIWQFTSSYFHPSIVSVSGGGFDMNHVFNWDTLDRITDQLGVPDMLVKVKAPPAGSPDWWPHIGLFQSGNHRPMVSDDIQGYTAEIMTDPTQYRILATSAGCDLTNNLPDGVTARITNFPTTQRVVGDVNATVTNWPPPSAQAGKWGMTGTVDLNAQTIDLNPK